MLVYTLLTSNQGWREYEGEGRKFAIGRGRYEGRKEGRKEGRGEAVI